MKHTSGQKRMDKLGLIHCILVLCFCGISNTVSATWNKEVVQKMVVNEADQQGFPAEIALAVAEVESDFNPYARSHVDARGVMQILPKTAEEDLGVSAASLYNPRVNIRAGVKFLKHLANVYDGRIDIALSHYNGGSRVRKADGSLRVISATQGYVDKVLNKAISYRTHPLVMKGEQNFNRYTANTFQRSKRAKTLSDFSSGGFSARGSESKTENIVALSSNAKTVEMSQKQTLIKKLNQLAFYNQNRVLKTATIAKKQNTHENTVNAGARRQYESKAEFRRALVRQWEML